MVDGETRFVPMTFAPAAGQVPRPEVFDFWRLGMTACGLLDLKRHDRWPYPSVIGASTNGDVAVADDSALGLLLAMVADATATRPIGSVLALAGLTDDGLGTLRGGKMPKEAFRAVNGAEDVDIVLVPASGPAQRGLPASWRTRTVPVATLEEAVLAVFPESLTAFADVGTLRAEVEYLRRDGVPAAELLTACDRLLDAAVQRPRPSNLRLVGEYHALTAAITALGADSWLSEPVELPTAHASYSGIEAGPARQLHEQLEAVVAERFDAVESSIPPDLRLAYRHHLALRRAAEKDFSAALDEADRGLSAWASGEAGADFSLERRSMLQLRAHLRKQRALRLLGAGLGADAAAEMTRAQNDEAHVAAAYDASDGDELTQGAETSADSLLAYFKFLRVERRFDDLLDHWSSKSKALQRLDPADAVAVADLVVEAIVYTGRGPQDVPAPPLEGMLPDTAAGPWTIAQATQAWLLSWARGLHPAWRVPSTVRTPLMSWQSGKPLALAESAARRDSLVADALEDLRSSWRKQDWGMGEAAYRTLRFWSGESVAVTAMPPPPPPRLPKPAFAALKLAKGKTFALDDLPSKVIALDGAVRGPHFDLNNARFSFDHHDGCIRHVTLSTCEQVLDALRVGFDPEGFTVYVNDLDADTVIATWLLSRPSWALLPRVAAAVRQIGRVDALGPAYPSSALPPGIRYGLHPLLSMSTDKLRAANEGTWRRVVDQCLERLDLWGCFGDCVAPADEPSKKTSKKTAAAVASLEKKADGGPWAVYVGDDIHSFDAVYRRGKRAGVIGHRLRDGTWIYHIAKQSEFIDGFDVPAILNALREAEQAANPDQDDAHTWGGSTTVGGSPRNPDGSGSCLAPDAVFDVIQQAIAP